MDAGCVWMGGPGWLISESKQQSCSYLNTSLGKMKLRRYFLKGDQ